MLIIMCVYANPDIFIFQRTSPARIFDNLNDELMDKIAQDYVKYQFKEQMLMVGREDTFSYLCRGLCRLCRWLEESGFP
jgi:hypothetical protein